MPGSDAQREADTPIGFGMRAAHWVASGFGAGFAPKAPGTVGTLVAIPLYLLLRELPPAYYAGVVLAMFGVGVLLCRIVETRFARHDHPSIVWDEIVGYLIAMFLAPRGWFWVALGFALFRLFDIWKPFPIGAVDRRMRGGFGVMLDDALAGVAAGAVLQVTAYLVWNF